MVYLFLSVSDTFLLYLYTIYTLIIFGIFLLQILAGKLDLLHMKNDLDKLEYCTKILLSNAYLALPTTARQDIHKFETYTIQTNGEYLFT